METKTRYNPYLIKTRANQDALQPKSDIIICGRQDSLQPISDIIICGRQDSLQPVSDIIIRG